jgi:hypothetical protein
MGYSARNGKLGFECDVCGVFVGDIRLLKSCYRCHKDICPLHARLTLKPASLRPQFRPSRWDDRLCYVCPDCDEERQREELDDKAEEESEPAQPITSCQRCGANDEPPDMKTFGYRAPHFSNCERCGRLVCDQCLIEVYDPLYEYKIVCRDCYEAKEQQDAKKREEYWKEEEENKLEE